MPDAHMLCLLPRVHIYCVLVLRTRHHDYVELLVLAAVGVFSIYLRF